MIPTQFKNDASVWEALLDKMPLTAMIRNLGKMSSVGLLKPLSSASKLVVRRLSDQEYIRKSRVHPMTIMLAQGTYSKGSGRLGSNTWNVVQPIVDGLEDAFYKAFVNVVPTGKNIYIGLDVSGSMGCEFTPGSGITCAEAGAALAMVVARTEKNYAIYGFSSANTRTWGGGTAMRDLGFTARDTLKMAQSRTSGLTFGGTDCALPFSHAQESGMDVDAFVVITDNETWAGNIQPAQALKKYRKARNNNEVRSIVMAMTATPFSIADPKDPYMLDVVGFDANVPGLIADFIRGSAAGNMDEDDSE